MTAWGQAPVRAAGPSTSSSDNWAKTYWSEMFDGVTCTTRSRRFPVRASTTGLVAAARAARSLVAWSNAVIGAWPAAGLRSWWQAVPRASMALRARNPAGSRWRIGSGQSGRHGREGPSVGGDGSDPGGEGEEPDPGPGLADGHVGDGPAGLGGGESGHDHDHQ